LADDYRCLGFLDYHNPFKEFPSSNYYWLVVWNLKKTYFGNNNPNWIIFFRGVETTSQITNDAFFPGFLTLPHWFSAVNIHLMVINNTSDSAGCV
jgi:hypothetical protein